MRFNFIFTVFLLFLAGCAAVNAIEPKPNPCPAFDFYLNGVCDRAKEICASENLIAGNLYYECPDGQSF